MADDATNPINKVYKQLLNELSDSAEAVIQNCSKNLGDAKIAVSALSEKDLSEKDRRLAAKKVGREFDEIRGWLASPRTRSRSAAGASG